MLLIILFKATYEYICLTYFPVTNYFRLELNVVKYSISWIVVFIMFVIQDKLTFTRYNHTFSSTVIRILFFVYYLPTISLFGMMDLPYRYFLLTNLYWLSIVMFQCFIPRFKFKKIKEKYISKTFISIFVLFCTFAMVAFVYSYNRFNITIDLSETYEVRKAAELAGIPKSVEILRNFTSLYLFPMLIVTALFEKKWTLASVFIIAQLLVFSIAMDKMNLFMIPICFGYYLFEKRNKASSSKLLLPMGLLLANVLGIIETLILQTYFVVVSITRRMFLVPSVLNYVYYDFMQTHEKIYLRESLLLHRFFDNPHGKPLLRVISDVYYDGIMHPNNGMFSEAYSQFGTVGIIILPLLLIIMFRMFDSVSYDVKNRYIFIVAVSMSIALLNVNITSGTIIFSNILLFVTLYFLSSMKNIKTDDGIKY